MRLVPDSRASVLLVTLTVTIASRPSRGQDALPALVVPPPSGPVVVRLHVNDADHLSAVAGELDIWEAHRDEGYVVARVTPDQYAWLDGLGYRLERLAEQTAALQTIAGLDPRFHFFDNFHPNANGLYVIEFLQDVHAANPGITELVDIGDAWMADQPGEHDRDIWVLRITNEDPAFGPIADKPAFFLFATIHAREVAVPELAIRYIKYLTQGLRGEGGYGVDADVTWLVDHHVIHILVMQNPDGHWKNEQSTDLYRRKNMNWTDGCGSPSSWGVDLNRNHSFLWGCCGGSSADPCGETYRGLAPASEPETQAFQAYFTSVMKDQNGPNGDNEIAPAAPDDTTGVFISLHSYSDIVFWPWAFSSFGQAPNHAQLETIGRKLANYNGYDPAGSLWYEMDGATDDWAYGKFGLASFTIEVGPNSGTCGGFFPPFGCVDGIDNMPRNFWAENKPALLYAHKIARTPYITSSGPDTEDVRATPSSVRPGETVELTALIADRRYGGDPLQPIVAAEFFVGMPGEDGAGIPMAPADGTWGGLTEDVTATVDTGPFGYCDRLYALVHGRGASGIWGPYSAAFIEARIPADFDCSSAVDLTDHAIFTDCLGGPRRDTPSDACTLTHFGRTDLDQDTDTDLADFAALQATFRD